MKREDALSLVAEHEERRKAEYEEQERLREIRRQEWIKKAPERAKALRLKCDIAIESAARVGQRKAKVQVAEKDDPANTLTIEGLRKDRFKAELDSHWYPAGGVRTEGTDYDAGCEYNIVVEW